MVSESVVDAFPFTGDWDWLLSLHIGKGPFDGGDGSTDNNSKSTNGKEIRHVIHPLESG